MEEILKLRRVWAGYGRITVLRDVSLSVPKGKTLGIIGPNGSGKTTLMNVLSGQILPSRGKILLEGRDISRLSPDIRCHMGIGRTFQVPRPFARLTVRENVVAAAAFSGRLSRMETRAAVSDVLDAMSLSEKAEIPAGKLSLLDRKRLEIARALATKPQLLLLDEIAAGLTSAEVREVLAIVERLKAQELTILWIEHIIETMLRAADQLICMAEGEVCVSGIPEEVLSSPEVGRLYLGSGSEERKDAGD